MPRDLGVRTRIGGGVGTWAVELGELPASLSGSEGTLGAASGLTGRGRSRGTRWALPAVEARESRVADESLGGPGLAGFGTGPFPSRLEPARAAIVRARGAYPFHPTEV
ncbi:hypothetical protein J1605_001226 [Eschrichtius robustus]|uniref:Uncharacterized protein n=1 Tax=Eschrichtius robustus TaxID=9764 RepID=A0AB34GDA4_ESCRO|nr:hypothetical protein J1605_001226 [Eschrichtius robustus]